MGRESNEVTSPRDLDSSQGPLDDHACHFGFGRFEDSGPAPKHSTSQTERQSKGLLECGDQTPVVHYLSV